jgi:hypothetical protein
MGGLRRTDQVKIVCSWATLAEVLAEPNAADLIRAYVDELSPLDAPADPDWGAMAAMEGRGEYRIWACYVEGTLAGYIAFHILPHLDYRGVLFAFTPQHYLSSAFRDKADMLGWRMWRSAMPALRELGVRFLMPHDSSKRSLLPFMLAMDARPIGCVYLKEL